MTYLNVVLAGVLALLAALHADSPDRALWLPAYGIGAGLALLSCRGPMGLWTVRTLATVSTIAMFGYFAGFFSRAGQLSADWYTQDGSFGTLALLLAGFAMIPVVSGYSCRMKPQTADAG